MKNNMKAWRYKRSRYGSVILLVKEILCGFDTTPERDLHSLHYGWTPDRLDAREDLERMTDEDVQKVHEIFCKLIYRRDKDLYDTLESEF